MKKHLKLILFFIFSFAIVITLFLCYINSFNSFSTISLVTSNKSNLNLNLNNNLNLANFYSSNFSSNDNIIAYLSIPKISLFNVPIEYGTNKNVLSKAIGLFENSNIEGGNICLAAHNRSNTVSYFKDLWKLNIGDEILLKTKDKFTTYTVMFKTEILSNDWTYLQNEKEDYITCITCIDNKPNKRLCIRGVKK